ncbi:MAG: CBS domain-containing protein [Verrucomicrobiales bacterium]|jgi:CBS domain-containing protein
MSNIVSHFENTLLSDMQLSSQAVINSGTAVRDSVLAMANADTSCAFIMDEAGIAGIFTEHDVTHRVVRSPDVWDMPVDEFMTPSPHVIDRSASALGALQAMGRGGFRNMPVVLDEAGRYANVTHFDLILLASRYLQDQPNEGDSFSAEHVLRYVDFYGMPSKVPVEVTSDTSLFDVCQLMINRDRGLISIVDGRGVVIGEFTQHDVFRKVACRVEDLNDETVESYMTEAFASALPASTIADGLHEMAAKRHRYLVLTNETGRSVGVVTFRDIAQFFEAAFAIAAN